MGAGILHTEQEARRRRALRMVGSRQKRSTVGGREAGGDGSSEQKQKRNPCGTVAVCLCRKRKRKEEEKEEEEEERERKTELYMYDSGVVPRICSLLLITVINRNHSSLITVINRNHSCR
jgi:hypothetical protein